jgi:hypothetical protein
MSNLVQQLELVEVPPPYKDSKLAIHVPVPREVENLTLIDGKTFLSTRLAGDIVPAGATHVGFFHDDTRFLGCLELRVGGRPTMVLSSNTEKSFTSQIELTTQPIRARDSFEIPVRPLPRPPTTLSNWIFSLVLSPLSCGLRKDQWRWLAFCSLLCRPYRPCPDFRVPFFLRCIALSTDLPADLPYFRPRELFFLAGIFVVLPKNLESA